MSKQRYINTRFWDDNYIVELNSTEKLIFLYFLTNPLTNICGIYELPIRRISFDTGIDIKDIDKVIIKFSKEEKIYYIEGWIYIVNFLKHQVLSEKIKIGVTNSLSLVPESVIKIIKEVNKDTGKLDKIIEFLK